MLCMCVPYMGAWRAQPLGVRGAASASADAAAGRRHRAQPQNRWPRRRPALHAGPCAVPAQAACAACRTARRCALGRVRSEPGGGTVETAGCRRLTTLCLCFVNAAPWRCRHCAADEVRARGRGLDHRARRAAVTLLILLRNVSKWDSRRAGGATIVGGELVLQTVDAAAAGRAIDCRGAYACVLANAQAAVLAYA